MSKLDGIRFGRSKNNYKFNPKDRRNGSGENSSNHKLTWEQVRNIRVECKDISRKQLSEKYGVSINQINAIIKNKSWVEKLV